MLHTPGHAPGAVCLYSAGPRRGVHRRHACSRADPGATGRSFSDRDVLEESIRAKLFALPDDTVVHTGHGDSTTIEAEADALGR